MATEHFYYLDTYDVPGPTPTPDNWAKYIDATKGTPTEITFQAAKTTTEYDYGFSTGTEPNSAQWANGTWKVYVDISTGSSDCYLTVTLERINSSWTVQETKTSDEGEQTASAGLKTFTFSSITWSSGSTGDRIRITFAWRVPGHSNIDMGIDSDDTYLETTWPFQTTANLSVATAAGLNATATGTGTIQATASLAAASGAALSAIGTLTGQRQMVVTAESGNLEEVQTTTSGFTLVTDPVCYGIYAFRGQATGAGTCYLILAGYDTTGAPGATLLGPCTNTYIRMYWRAATLPASADEEILIVRRGTTIKKAALRVASDGSLRLYDQGGVQRGGDSPNKIRTGKWYRIEVKIGSHDTAGDMILRVNGITWISTTGPTNAIAATNVILGKGTNQNSQTVDFYYDDIAISAQTWPGATRCVQLIPDGNGYYTDWTASAGEKWQCIDETPATSGEYIYTATANTKYSCALESASSKGINGTIRSVTAYACVQEESIGTSEFHLGLRVSNQDGNLTDDWNANIAYDGIFQLVETPPTGGSWSNSLIDSTEVIISADVGTPVHDCSKLAIFVEYDYLNPICGIAAVGAVALDSEAETGAQSATASLSASTVAGLDTVGAATGTVERDASLGIATLIGLDATAEMGVSQATASLAPATVVGLAAPAEATGDAPADISLAIATATGLAAPGEATGDAPADTALALLTAAGLSATAEATGDAPADVSLAIASAIGLSAPAEATGTVERDLSVLPVPTISLDTEAISGQYGLAAIAPCAIVGISSIATGEGTAGADTTLAPAVSIGLDATGAGAGTVETDASLGVATAIGIDSTAEPGAAQAYATVAPAASLGLSTDPLPIGEAIATAGLSVAGSVSLAPEALPTGEALATASVAPATGVSLDATAEPGPAFATAAIASVSVIGIDTSATGAGSAETTLAVISIVTASLDTGATGTGTVEITHSLAAVTLSGLDAVAIPGGIATQLSSITAAAQALAPSAIGTGTAIAELGIAPVIATVPQVIALQGYEWFAATIAVQSVLSAFLLAAIPSTNTIWTIPRHPSDWEIPEHPTIWSIK